MILQYFVFVFSTTWCRKTHSHWNISTDRWTKSQLVAGGHLLFAADPAMRWEQQFCQRFNACGSMFQLIQCQKIVWLCTETLRINWCVWTNGNGKLFWTWFPWRENGGGGEEGAPYWSKVGHRQFAIIQFVKGLELFEVRNILIWGNNDTIRVSMLGIVRLQ